MIVIAYPGPGNVIQSPSYYFADTSADGDGWCGPLREHRLSAVLDARDHRLAMAATKDERR